MKVTEEIARAKKPLLSFEVLPPTKGKSINSLFEALDPFMEFKPSFVNVTYHRAEQLYKKRIDGTFERIEIRKRPGTVGICAAIMNKYQLEAIPHLICGGFSKEETENALIDLHYLGIKNVLALRGDAAANEKFFVPHPQGHKYAHELVDQIIQLNKGQYIEDDIIEGVKSDFCIGVAGYPEKHMESPNVDIDIEHLKNKIALGAHYINTQMFFDNNKYYEFKRKCELADIHVPIIPGIKPLTSDQQLHTIPRIFHVDVPMDLYQAMKQCTTKAAMEQVGTEWLLMQCRDLLAHNVPVLHFYTMSKPNVIYNVLKELF
jgi:methylenetetrahydrofolate reductase (NADPH)